jgi:predicted site-specific integrase-resolvase
MKGKEAALRIGQAAAQLKVSNHHLRQLCKCGLVEADQSPAGQWRIPLSEIQRLQSVGVPPPPTFIEEGGSHLGAAPSAEGLPETHVAAAASGPTHLPAPPSPAVIMAQEDAEIEEAAVRKEEAAVRRKESTVRKLHLEFEEQQAQDQLNARKNREHTQTEANRAAARQSEEQTQHAEWVEQWAEQALRGLPRNIAGALRLELHNAVSTRLANLPRIQSNTLTQQLIDAETDRVLRPWKRQLVVDRAVESVCERLPFDLRYSHEYRARKSQAAQIARKAIEQLGDVPQWQMEATGSAAVMPIVIEFEHQQRCAKLAATLPFDLTGLTSSEQTEAREQILDRLSHIPVNTPQRKLEQVRDEALLPFRQLLAKRQHEHRIEYILRLAPYRLPSRMSSADQKEALEEVRRAVAKLPIGASQHDMEVAKDRVVNRIRQEQEQEKRFAALVDCGIREVYPYVQRLVRRGLVELEDRETAFSIAADLKDVVRETLDELDGIETEEEVKKLVHDVVSEELDI